MKAFVVFGSASDDDVSRPLAEALSRTCEVEREVISAHRDLEKLQTRIAGWTGDVVVAGAGVAAALPGVVAAMTTAPVFGVPVPSQFAGLDSFASIAQMPPGVPVMSCGPAGTGAIVSFLAAYAEPQAGAFSAVHFVTGSSDPELGAEIEKARTPARDKGIEMTVGPAAAQGAFNVYIVEKAEDIRPEAFGLHVPFIPKDKMKSPATYLTVMDWANKGGLWVGVNNTRNAVHAAVRLRRMA